MATLKYKNGNNWVAAPISNGTHDERWSSVGVTRTNNVYGTPTATVSKEPIDASGACEMSFKFSNLRGAPGGTGGTGPLGTGGTALYILCAFNNNQSFSFPNISTDTFSSMRIATKTTRVTTSCDNYALGAYPISHNTSYGNIYLSPNTTEYSYIIGLSGGFAMTGLNNETSNTRNASMKAGIGFGTAAATTSGWWVTYPIYWLTYQRQFTVPEKMIDLRWSGTDQGYYMLCARRNGGDPASTDMYQSYLTAVFYGRIAI